MGPVNPMKLTVMRGGSLGARRERLNLAGREGQRGVGREPHHLGGGVIEAPHGLPARQESRQQAHSLEELEAEGFPFKPGCDARGGYSKILCPALGGHCLRTSFLCGVLTTSWLKLFIETYSPRKHSSTAANR